MVQRNDESSVNYLASIIQWINNSPPPHHPQQQQSMTSQKPKDKSYEIKTNPRRQLLSHRSLKRNKRRASLSLPEFEQKDVVIDTKLS